MNPLPRAVLFDVYHTLLDVRTLPGQVDRRWEALCQRTFGKTPEFSFEEISDLCRTIVAGDLWTILDRHPEPH